jgi:hypothetical protein
MVLREKAAGALLCEATENECNKLRDLNLEIANGPCKPIEAPGIQVSPTETPAPTSPR